MWGAHVATLTVIDIRACTEAIGNAGDTPIRGGERCELSKQRQATVACSKWLESDCNSAPTTVTILACSTAQPLTSRRVEVQHAS